MLSVILFNFIFTSLSFLAEEIASVYELAVAKNPKNEEFLSHLFMAYVRIGNNLKQQKVSILQFCNLLLLFLPNILR